MKHVVTLAAFADRLGGQCVGRFTFRNVQAHQITADLGSGTVAVCRGGHELRAQGLIGVAMRVFLDADTLFSAAKSDGAVRSLVNLLLERGHACQVDAYVVAEARRNLIVTPTGGRSAA